MPLDTHRNVYHFVVSEQRKSELFEEFVAPAKGLSAEEYDALSVWFSLLAEEKSIQQTNESK